MANSEHLAILKHGVEVWNNWRQENPTLQPDFTGADLRGADFSLPEFNKRHGTGKFLHGLVQGRRRSNDTTRFGLDFHGANLSGARLNQTNLNFAYLSGAILKSAKLTQADLRFTNFFEADLTEATLVEADLRSANLCSANMHKANLGEANLRGSILVQAKMDEAILTWADLRKARLDQADLTKADFSHANLTGCLLLGATLTDADLTQAQLVGTELADATMTRCRVFGSSVWQVGLSGTLQKELIITPPDEAAITVDNLEVAQFIYLLLNNNKIRTVIDTITSKVVLILGRFTDERKAVLDALRDELRKRNYSPVLFDFDKPASRDLTETISTLAHMARFIIADITEPKCIPHELATIVPTLSVPVKPLLLKGATGEYAMFQDLRKYPWVMTIHRYKDSDQLIQSLEAEIIAPVERKAKALIKSKNRYR